MTSKQLILKRVNELISLADRAIAAAGTNDFPPLFNQFRSQGLSLIANLYGTSQPYFSEFEKGSRRESESDAKNCKGILAGIKHDVDNDYYLTSITGLVSAEIFGDYLDMAQYYLDSKHKDAAAVIIGSTLESHLKKLAQKNNLPIDYTDGKGQVQPMTANTLNTNLYKAAIYNKIEHSSIEAWIKIRNEAAHGNYSQYTQQHVEGMLSAVRSFMTNHPS